jgi:hypothetical protein
MTRQFEFGDPKLPPPAVFPQPSLLSEDYQTMKANPIFLLLFVSLFATAAFGQSSSKVTLRLKNNGLLPREFKFLEKRAGMKPDNVFTAYILPGRSFEVKLKVGTSLTPVCVGRT